MNKQVKVDTEMANAALVQSLLNGGTDVVIGNPPFNPDITDEMLGEAFGNEEETAPEFEFGEEVDAAITGKRKKKASTTKKTGAKRTSKKKTAEQEIEEAERRREADKLPTVDWADFTDGVRFAVVLNKHDIPYKEQLWPVPERTVVYVLSQAHNKTQAVAYGKEFTDGKITDELRQKVDAGDSMFFKVRVLDGVIVPTRIMELGVVEVAKDKRVRVNIKRMEIDNAHGNVDDVMKDIRSAIKVAVKFK